MDNEPQSYNDGGDNNDTETEDMSLVNDRTNRGGGKIYLGKSPPLRKKASVKGKEKVTNVDLGGSKHAGLGAVASLNKSSLDTTKADVTNADAQDSMIEVLTEGVGKKKRKDGSSSSAPANKKTRLSLFRGVHIDEAKHKDAPGPSSIACARKGKEPSKKCKKKKEKVSGPKVTECIKKPNEVCDHPDEHVKSSNFPSLYTRTTPAAFHDALEKLNEKQRAAVCEIGFGHVLSLRVKKLPNLLAYWVLNNFDGKSCELEVRDGLRVKVTEDDVYRIFGFPKGSETIKSFRTSSNHWLMDEWVSSFNVESRDQIKITLLLERMVNDRDGGTWFKRNFMIAMGFSLIESCPNGQVQPYLLRTLEDVRTLRKWNWGGFVLKTLVDQKRNWLNNARTVFVGPTLFLLLFYVDRFEVHMTKHPRLYPVLVNWDSKDLRKRQKVEKDDRYFGGGSLCEPISLPDMTHDVDSEDTVQSELEITMMKQAIMISDGVKILQSLLARASDAQRESQGFMDNLANVSRISGVTLDIHYRGDGAGTSGCKEDDESFNNNPVNDSEVYEPLQDLMDTRPIYSEQQTVHDFTFSHGNDEVGAAGGCDMYGIHSHHEKLVNVCTNPGLEDDCTFELNRVGDNSTVTDNDEITNACSEGTGVHSVGENISFGKDVECVPNMDNENIAHTDNAAISDQVRDKRKGKMVSTRGRDVPFVGLRKSKRVRVKGNVIQENDGNVSVDVPLLVKKPYVRKTRNA